VDHGQAGRVGCPELKDGALLEGFCPSYATPSRTVNDIFCEQLPVSFELGIYAYV
jgi:hypothetical protein